MNAEISRTLLSFGADTFSVQRHGPIRSREEWERVRNRPPITPEDAEAVRKQSTLAAHVLTQADFRTEVRSTRDAVTEVEVLARSGEYPYFLEETIDIGRHFTEAEDRYGAPVAVLGSEISEALFPGEPSLGRTVRIEGRHFDVIGVMRPRGALLGESQDKYIFIPLETCMRKISTSALSEMTAPLASTDFTCPVTTLFFS
jgi:putative ABC transport system permease protein